MPPTRKPVQNSGKSANLKSPVLEGLPELKSEDSKILLSVLLEKIDELRQEFTAALKAKNLEISSLRGDVNALKSKVSQLELQLDEADSYERRDTLILTGESIPLHSQGEVCSEVARQVVSEKLKISLPPNSINTCHRLGRKPIHQTPDRRPIIVKFCQRDVKMEVLVSARKLRVSNFYANESLSPTRRSILYALRKIKKAHPNLVTGCTSYDGKIYAYTKPSVTAPDNSRSVRHAIKSKDHLREFCESFIKKPLEDFLDNWSD